MNALTQRAIGIFEKLDEASKLAVLRYAESLAAENADDDSLYDAAKAADNGYRVAASRLRAKYGI